MLIRHSCSIFRNRLASLLTLFTTAPEHYTPLDRLRLTLPYFASSASSSSSLAVFCCTSPSGYDVDCDWLFPESKTLEEAEEDAWRLEPSWLRTCSRSWASIAVSEAGDFDAGARLSLSVFVNNLSLSSHMLDDLDDGRIVVVMVNNCVRGGKVAVKRQLLI